MLTLRNCAFVDPVTTRTSTAVLCRTSPALGPDRPWSVRALVAGRDRARVLPVGVIVVKLSDLERHTDIDTEWIDRVFSDQHGVAAFFRQMSGARVRVEWQAFPATELMTSEFKKANVASLSRVNREAAKAAGIPVDAFRHWIWITDEGLSAAGNTPRGEDSYMGALDFTVSVATHELMHRFGAGHADAVVADDYGDGYCIMGAYQHGFTNSRLQRVPWLTCTGHTHPSAGPFAGPGLSAPFAHMVGWLPARNILALPGDAPVGTRIDLSVNAGAPSAEDGRIVAASIGALPTVIADPSQFWLEYRQARGFDRGINDGLYAEPPAGRPGVIHVSRHAVVPPKPDKTGGGLRTFLVGAAPAVVGARLNEVAGRTPRVEAVSSATSLVRLVLDPPVRYAYLFKGASYVRYDRLANRTDAGYPLPIAAFWHGMEAAGFAEGLDAALPWFGNRLYFFKGADYVRYDLAADRVDPGYPRPIAGNWPGLAEHGFGSDLDAAVNWGNEFAYFFKGSRYLRYDLLADTINGPHEIKAVWEGFADAGFGSDIDACIPWYDGMAYFLKGDKYLAYDMLAERLVGGARDIDPAWVGLATVGFGNGVRAGFCAPPPQA